MGKEFCWLFGLLSNLIIISQVLTQKPNFCNVTESYFVDVLKTEIILDIKKPSGFNLKRILFGGSLSNTYENKTREVQGVEKKEHIVEVCCKGYKPNGSECIPINDSKAEDKIRTSTNTTSASITTAATTSIAITATSARPVTELSIPITESSNSVSDNEITTIMESPKIYFTEKTNPEILKNEVPVDANSVKLLEINSTYEAISELPKKGVENNTIFTTSSQTNPTEVTMTLDLAENYEPIDTIPLPQIDSPTTITISNTIKNEADLNAVSSELSVTNPPMFDDSENKITTLISDDLKNNVETVVVPTQSPEINSSLTQSSPMISSDSGLDGIIKNTESLEQSKSTTLLFNEITPISIIPDITKNFIKTETMFVVISTTSQSLIQETTQLPPQVLMNEFQEKIDSYKTLMNSENSSDNYSTVDPLKQIEDALDPSTQVSEIISVTSKRRRRRRNVVQNSAVISKESDKSLENLQIILNIAEQNESHVILKDQENLLMHEEVMIKNLELEENAWIQILEIFSFGAIVLILAVAVKSSYDNKCISSWKIRTDIEDSEFGTQFEYISHVMTEEV